MSFGHKYAYVLGRIACGTKVRRHTLRRERAVAGGEGGIGLDEFLIDVMKALLAIVLLHAAAGCRYGKHRDQQGGGERAQAVNLRNHWFALLTRNLPSAQCARTHAERG